jgi:hypothetical protein
VTLDAMSPWLREVVDKLPWFACMELLGIVGTPRAEFYDERTARLGVVDAYNAFLLTDAQIIEVVTHYED